MTKSDINWRSIKEDKTLFEPSNQYRFVLVKTSIADCPELARIVLASRIDKETFEESSLKEIVTDYALL